MRLLITYKDGTTDTTQDDRITPIWILQYFEQKRNVLFGEELMVSMDEVRSIRLIDEEAGE